MVFKLATLTVGRCDRFTNFVTVQNKERILSKLIKLKLFELNNKFYAFRHYGQSFIRFPKTKWCSFQAQIQAL